LWVGGIPRPERRKGVAHGEAIGLLIKADVELKVVLSQNILNQSHSILGEVVRYQTVAMERFIMPRVLCVRRPVSNPKWA
jgi:hypothetical protein